MKSTVIIVRVLIIAAAAGIAVGCSSGAALTPDRLSLRVERAETGAYSITDVRIDSVNVDSVKVLCRVRKSGRYADGRLTAVVASDGVVVLRKEVRPFHYRRGQASYYGSGFPFVFTLPRGPLRNSTLRLDFIGEGDE